MYASGEHILGESRTLTDWDEHHFPLAIGGMNEYPFLIRFPTTRNTTAQIEMKWNETN